MTEPGRSWLTEQGDAYVYGFSRAAFGVLLLFQTGKQLKRTLARGYFGDAFHMPLVPGEWVPSEPVYLAALGLVALGALLAVLGIRGREGLLVASVTGVYLLLCNRLEYHNNRFALFLMAFVCAFLPADRSFLFARGRALHLPAEQRVAPLWARRLLGLTVSAIYVSSGGGKLLDPDWRGGQTMLVRFSSALEHALAKGVAIPDWYADLARSPAFASLASKAAISLELVLAFALWVPQTRALALWAGALFHLGIELSARVELFSFVMAAGYIAFVVPEVREREVAFETSSRAGRAVGRLLPWLDWLARFDVRPLDARGEPASWLVARDRDGELRTGLGAFALVARGLPVLFPLWGVLAAISALFRRIGRS